MDCVKCGSPVGGKFRLVWNRKGYERLCQTCARNLDAFVAEHGHIGRISMTNPRFVYWLEEDRWLEWNDLEKWRMGKETSED
ncbi:MAG: hypothetical protein ACETWB_00465 [Anaerolineae bacterium]